MKRSLVVWILIISFGSLAGSSALNISNESSKNVSLYSFVRSTYNDPRNEELFGRLATTKALLQRSSKNIGTIFNTTELWISIGETTLVMYFAPKNQRAILPPDGSSYFRPKAGHLSYVRFKHHRYGYDYYPEIAPSPIETKTTEPEHNQLTITDRFITIQLQSNCYKLWVAPKQ